MCGILGIWSCNEYFSLSEFEIFQNCIKTLRHRGPDDEGYLAVDTEKGDIFNLSPNEINKFSHKANLFLSHCRLSIIDLSGSGHQPMSNEDKSIWIVYNGEIYNFRELREELKKSGHIFISNTDTEVIIHSYEEYGFECVNKFNGMWAFAIYDRNKNILFLSRDRFGVKPLYYYFDKKYFAFASEIKALLLLPFYKKEINYSALFEYLVIGSEEYEKEGFFKKIYELKPSFNILLELKENRLKEWQYYFLKYKEDWEDFNIQEFIGYKNVLKELIFNAVKLRLISDVPVGSCLSGGIDSSSIVVVIGEILKKENIEQIGERQKVFTASYRNEEIDETIWAKIVADKVKADWFITYPDEDELFKELDDLIYYQEIPFGSLSIYAQYKVMKLAKEKGVKVLLDGQGGDELFSGYPGCYPNFFLELLWKKKYKILYRELLNVKNSPVKFNYLFLQTLKKIIGGIIPENFYYLVNLYPLKFLKKEFIKENISAFSKLKESISKSLNQHLYNLITAKTFKNLKTVLKYEDRNSMRFSIEARVPFSDDINLIEYVFKIPPVYKIHNGYSKYILRESLKGILPEEIIKRSDKIGFVVPEVNWFKKKENSIIEIIKNCTSLNFLIDYEKLLNEIKSGKIYLESFVLWRFLNAILWYEKFK